MIGYVAAHTSGQVCQCVESGLAGFWSGKNLMEGAGEEPGDTLGVRDFLRRNDGFGDLLRDICSCAYKITPILR